MYIILFPPYNIFYCLKPFAPEGDRKRSDEKSTEGITQLILTLYFRNRGYIVRGDIGKMMDMAIFDVPLLDKLREMYFIEKGMVPIDLLLNIPYGLVRKFSKTFNNGYKSLAIEIGSYSVKEGVKQLREWIKPLKLNDVFREYTQPFERAVVGIPKCHEEEKDIDVLTYDEDGIQYIECSDANIAEREIINQEIAKEYVKDLIVQTVYDFLPAKHFKYVSECSLLGDLLPNIRKEIEKKH